MSSLLCANVLVILQTFLDRQFNVPDINNASICCCIQLVSCLCKSWNFATKLLGGTTKNVGATIDQYLNAIDEFEIAQYT